MRIELYKANGTSMTYKGVTEEPEILNGGLVIKFESPKYGEVVSNLPFKINYSDNSEAEETPATPPTSPTIARRR